MMKEFVAKLKKLWNGEMVDYNYNKYSFKVFLKDSDEGYDCLMSGYCSYSFQTWIDLFVLDGKTMKINETLYPTNRVEKIEFVAVADSFVVTMPYKDWNFTSYISDKEFKNCDGNTRKLVR